MSWTVQIETASLGWECETDLGLSLKKCLFHLAPHDPRGTCNADGWAINLSLDVADMAQAWRAGLTAAFNAARAGGLPLWPIVAVYVSEGEYSAAMAGMSGSRSEWLFIG